MGPRVWYGRKLPWFMQTKGTGVVSKLQCQVVSKRCLLMSKPLKLSIKRSETTSCPPHTAISSSPSRPWSCQGISIKYFMTLQVLSKAKSSRRKPSCCSNRARSSSWESASRWGSHLESKANFSRSNLSLAAKRAKYLLIIGLYHLLRSTTHSLIALRTIS